MRAWRVVVAVAVLGSVWGCGDNGKREQGRFPSLFEAAKETAPSIQASANGAGLTYDDGWTGLQLSQPGGRILEILADPNAGGVVPITNIYAVLQGLDGLVERLNSEYSDGDSFVECTQSLAGDVETPWWDDNAQAPFFSAELANAAFQCYVETTTGDFLAVGSEATEGDCDDPTIYHLIAASTSHEETPAALPGVPNRGAATRSSSTRATINACTGDIQLFLAQGGGYADESIFSSRTELIGNRAAHDFRLRVLIVGREGPGALQFGQVIGSGVSRGAGSNLILSWLDPSLSRTYCLEGTDADGQFIAANDCDTSLEARFEGIAPYAMSENEIPLATVGETLQAPFTVNAASFGL